MSEKNFEIYKNISDILNSSLDLVKNNISVNKSVYELCKLSDDFILENLKSIYKKYEKGLSMPTSISVNSIVAHNCQSKENDYLLKKNDIIRIEMACHINNCHSTIGDTIKVDNKDFLKSNLMNVANKAIELSLKYIDEDVDSINFNSILYSLAKQNNLFLIMRPYVFEESGASLRYDWCQIDNGKFLEQSWVVKNDNELDLDDSELEMEDDEYDKLCRFQINNVYHFEIALSDSDQKSLVSDELPMLYQKTNRYYSLKSKFAKQLMNNLKDKNYIFKLDQISMPLTRIKIGLKECLKHGVIRNLGLIKNNGNVVRLKWSIIVRKSGPYLLTNKINLNNNVNLNDKLNKLIETPIKFNDRKSAPKII